MKAMKRGDAVVVAVSAGLAIIAVAAVVFSVVVLDRKARPAPDASSSSLLVLTWAPSLCPIEPSNSGCRSGHVDSLGAKFMLHGLWPQPSSEQYCDVPRQTPDKARQPISLPDAVSSQLETMMSDSSRMAKHEWYAHGTCSGVSPAEYFSVATALSDQAAGILNPLFNGASGRQLTSKSMREAFDARLGKGAGSRVALVCKGARDEGAVAFEVRLSLPPVSRLAQNPQPLGEALAAGPTVPPGCGQARVP